METQAFTFAASRFVPVAVGFFGLGTGYFIWGGQALFGFPKTTPEVNKTMGMWGFWMPGFMQFITCVYLLIGLTWFNVMLPLYIWRVWLLPLTGSIGLLWRIAATSVPVISRMAGWRSPSCFLAFWRRCFSPLGGHTRDDHLRRLNTYLCCRNSDASIRVEPRGPPCGFGSVCHGNLAYVLYLRHHCGIGA